MDLMGVWLGAGGLALGGVLKGATGAGAPLVAVPLLSMLYGVPVAVAVFCVPNLLANLWQAWTFRSNIVSPRFVLRFALAGALGALMGTWLLVRLSADTLLLIVAISVLAYVGFRLARPDWSLGRPVAARLAAPVGLLGGVMFGASGISAPVSVTFLNAMRPQRGEFIVTIAAFFAGTGLVQVPALAAAGILTVDLAALSLAACVPIFGAMPLGAWLARKLSKETFDRLILGLLSVIALRLLIDALL